MFLSTFCRMTENYILFAYWKFVFTEDIQCKRYKWLQYVVYLNTHGDTYQMDGFKLLVLRAQWWEKNVVGLILARHDTPFDLLSKSVTVRLTTLFVCLWQFCEKWWICKSYAAMWVSMVLFRVVTQFSDGWNTSDRQVT